MVTPRKIKNESYDFPAVASGIARPPKRDTDVSVGTAGSAEESRSPPFSEQRQAWTLCLSSRPA